MSDNAGARHLMDWEQFLVNTRKLGYRDEKVEAVARECGYDRAQIWRVLTEQGPTDAT